MSVAGSRLGDRQDELLKGWQGPAAVLHRLRSACRKLSVHGDKRVSFLFLHDSSPGYASVSLVLECERGKCVALWQEVGGPLRCI